MTRTGSPRFTLISPVYGVAGFLEDFIASIEAQTFDLERVQVVMVDDGSVDGSLGILKAWAERRPGLVRVVRQENAGQAAARNTGLEHATGEWVSFPDPDDALSDRYLEHVDGFLSAHPQADLVATNRWIWNEATGQTTNTHPVRHMFQRDRVVDLTTESHYFYGPGNAAFFRRDRIESEAIRFDTRIRPAFEDGHFTIVYLLCTSTPQVAFLKSARYLYRKRRDGSSTLQTSKTHPGRYTLMFEHGFLDVIDRAIKRQGSVPRWLQSFLVFELSWYFTLTDARSGPGVPTSGPRSERVHALIRQTLAHLEEPEVIERAMVRLQRIPRYVLLHGYAARPWHEPFVLLTKLDRQQQVVQATYFFTGEPPVEEILLDGRPALPQHAKSVDYDFMGQTLLRRRILWIPSNAAVTIRLDGQDMPAVFRRPEFPVDVATPAAMRRNLPDPRAKVTRRVETSTEPVPTTREGRKAQRLSTSAAVERRYRRAWVLMDRIHNAGDSGEILFKHLREHHANINAWFVLEKGTAAWQRLRSEGYADRLVAHGSMAWRLLMANAWHLISSHADEAITHPPAIVEFTRPRWKFTFLNHGVIKDDLSGWLNHKPIETFVTSTTQEYESIAGDSAYVFSSREVKLTGMPRFDRLRTVGLRFGPDRRDLLLVSPTWRKGLMSRPRPGTQRRTMDAAVISTSEFMRCWRAFVEDDRLRTEADRHGVRIAFLPHPNLQPVLTELGLPPHVELLSYDRGDVQEYFARARLLVTDFSSVAFNQAYLERPVVYYQFDEDEVLGGAHVGRAGYFDYRSEGFGPVTTTTPDAVSAAVDALDHGPVPMEPYLSRMADSFPQRDGQCSERVFRAIRRTMRDRTRDTPEPTPGQRRAITR
jgi:glycosyltransferase involved in cell wall biosynthesis